MFALAGQIVTAVALVLWVPVGMAIVMLLSDDPNRTRSPWPPIAILLYPAAIAAVYFWHQWHFFFVPPAWFFAVVTTTTMFGVGLLAWAVIRTRS